MAGPLWLNHAPHTCQRCRGIAGGAHTGGPPENAAAGACAVLPSGTSATLLCVGSLAAGVVGSLLTIVVAFLVRLAHVPAEIRSNDRRARERDDDLEQWIADRNLFLQRELDHVRGTLAARGALESGDYAFEIAVTKERALHEWRDQ
jgi:hypothetical protein